MNTAVCGSDIIRAYELSWLSATGKPQLATLEITQDYNRRTFDTWKFKEFMESIHNDFFVNIEALHQKIAEYATIDNDFEAKNVRLICNKDFPNYNFFEIQHSNNLITNGVRCICQRTGQPYIGTLNLVLKQAADVSQEAIANVLKEFRNAEFMPQNFATALYSKVQALLQQQFIFSLHLNRRGGISYQALRSNYKTDLTAFTWRSILE